MTPADHDTSPGTKATAPESVVITRRLTFSAAHILCRDDWSPERNEEVFGACAHDHGHNYTLEVSVSGRPDAATGMVINLKELDLVVRDAVVSHVDHRHLNRDVAFLTGVIPTAENLVLAFWARIEERLRRGRLERLRLVESENNTAEVTRT